MDGEYVAEDEHGISTLGFLPECPCTKLPFAYSYLQPLVDALEENKGVNFKLVMQQVVTECECSELNVQHEQECKLLPIAQVRYLYSVLSMIISRHVWGNGVSDACNHSHLPACIGIPYLLVSAILGIVPALTYAAVDLYNWHLVDATRPFSLDNIITNHTMTGDISEVWFHKIMIAIEGVGGALLKRIQNPTENTEKLLIDLASILFQCTGIIKLMYKHCDPAFFFNNIRIYVGGSDSEFLPNGLTIEGSSTVLKYGGGSAGQSSLLQVFDEYLCIDHTTTFLQNMRQYMPRQHAQFIQLIHKQRVPDQFTQYPELYNACIGQLTRFRQAHLGLIQRYIMAFVKINENIEAINKNTDRNAHGNKGAGGTDPETFGYEMVADTNKMIMVDDDSQLTSSYVGPQSSTNSDLFYIYVMVFCIVVAWLLG